MSKAYCTTLTAKGMQRLFNFGQGNSMDRKRSQTAITGVFSI